MSSTSFGVGVGSDDVIVIMCAYIQLIEEIEIDRSASVVSVDRPGSPFFNTIEAQKLIA